MGPIHSAEMTSAEADDRIILSRHTLKRYLQLAATGHAASHEDVPLIDRELEILDGIAEQHPDKVAKILGLVAEWLAFREGIRVTLH